MGEDYKMTFFWRQEGKLKDSSGLTAEEALEEFRKKEIKAITPYAISSVERNMFLAHLIDAINIAKPKDKEELLEKASKMLEITPYTNWSGD